MSPLVIILILVIVIIVVGIVIAVMMNSEAEKKRKAMSVITGHADENSSKVSDKDEQNKRRAEIAKKLKDAKDGDNDKDKKKVSTSLMLARAGLGISSKQYWIFSVISMVLLLLLGKMMNAGPFLMFLLGVIGLFGLPRFIVRHKTLKRQKNFLEEFPDALEAMVRLLKAGMPVAEAISMISREFEGPVGEEMMRVYDKQKIGIPLHEAALEATHRMPLTEMQMFATGLSIQAQTGSSLSEVLMNLSGVIRARFRLKRKIKALSAEAIASASIIGALPILVSLGLWFVNPEYIEILFTDSFGKLLLAGAVVWMCIGIFVMKLMINFKV